MGERDRSRISVHSELQDLQKEQSEIKDGTRLFHDGSIKTQTLTERGSIGWYVLAGPVRGAGISFKRYFPAHKDGTYLMANSVREAISIRDRMLSSLFEVRAKKEHGEDLAIARGYIAASNGPPGLNQ